MKNLKEIAAKLRTMFTGSRRPDPAEDPLVNKAATVEAQYGTDGAPDAAQHESVASKAVTKHRPRGQEPMPGNIPAWSLH